MTASNASNTSQILAPTTINTTPPITPHTINIPSITPPHSTRLRRLRYSSAMRSLVREHHLHASDFLYPLFVCEGKGVKNSIASMPGVYQMSIDNIIKECEEIAKLGILGVVLFGIPSEKDAIGSHALRSDSIIARSIHAIKRACPTLLIIADICMCEYTSHGHCGVLNEHLNSVDNDKTLALLAQQALILAQAGVDMLAPSAAMDGMVSALRQTLDTQGFTHLPIMSYSTKFASAYYAPFRDVAESAPSIGDRKSYQQDSSNAREAVLESMLDEQEGADILMVKPALAFLDIVKAVREASLLPLAIYNVSGEYAMLKAAQRANIINYQAVLQENLLSFKRAGADIIISYHAKEAIELGLCE